jgi:hypothetical protein
MALAPEELDRLEALHRERVAHAATEAQLDDVWNGLIEPRVDRFDSQETFDRFQRMEDEARARIEKAAATVTAERPTGVRPAPSLAVHAPAEERSGEIGDLPWALVSAS